MKLDKVGREKFAFNIAKAAGLETTSDGTKFIKNFSELKDLERDIFSNYWMENVIKWIASDNRSGMAREINTNYNNPQAVFNYIIEHKKPI